MKKALLILIAIMIIAYLFFSADYFRDSLLNRECKSFEVVVKDSVRVQFVTGQDIKELVAKHGLNPVGKQFKEVNTLAIHDTILTNRLVESVEVYTTPKGSIVANIKQREPVLRVISDVDGSYYIDKDRHVMPVSSSFAAYVPIATGIINEDFARGGLYDFAMFLNSNSRWDAWVEQIVVKRNNEVELIPRVGNFRIILGSLDDYPEKLTKFARFVEGGLNVIGWNRYSEINLKYGNQVVCTRRQ